MQNDDVETTTETQLVPDGYYDFIIDSVSYNNFVLSLLLGMFIIYLMIKGMRK